MRSLIFTFILLISQQAHSLVFFAHKAMFIGDFGFISWHIEKSSNTKAKRVSSCYKKYKKYKISHLNLEIGYSCIDEKKFQSWIDENADEFHRKMEKIKSLIDDLFDQQIQIKLRVIITFENSSIKKKFYYFGFKFLPVNIIAQFSEDGAELKQSYANLSASIIHELTHLYQAKYLKDKFRKLSGQHQEAFAEIAGICGLLAMDYDEMEDPFAPSFKKNYKEGISPAESLEKTQYGLQLKNNHPNVYERSVGYVLGRFLIWEKFGTKIKGADKKDIYMFCKNVINEVVFPESRYNE